jgi:hypothetical protein
MSRQKRQSRAAPKTSKADKDRELARKSFAWTKRGTILTGIGIVVSAGVAVAIAAFQSTSDQGTASQQPKGIEVTTVPIDRIGGAPILPVPVVTVAPIAYLSAGVQLHIDCLQEVQGKYLLAQISSGQYQNEWIDVFDIETPDGQEVQKLSQPPPECNAL